MSNTEQHIPWPLLHVLVQWLELEIAEWVFIVRKKPSGSVTMIPP